MNLLDRSYRLGTACGTTVCLKSEQQVMEQLVSGFVEGASDWKSLSSMMLGGLAYRLGKMAVYAVGVNNHLPLLKILAPILALTSEVTVFRGMNHLLQNGWRKAGAPSVVLSEQRLLRDAEASPVLYFQSWFTDFINFGSLRIFGNFCQGQNLFFAHFIQDTAMLVGHHLSYRLGLSTKPSGTWVEQFAHAEIMNLQMQAGMTLFHRIFPTLSTLERSLDFRNEMALRVGKLSSENLSLFPVFANQKPLPDTEPSAAFPPLETKDVVPLESVASEKSFALGSFLGPAHRYQIVKLLGSGGFGDVYQVLDRTLERHAVIKVQRERRDHAHLQTRFEREIKIGANLDPRYTVAVYDVVEIAPNRQVPVMEYVPGNDMANILGNLQHPFQKPEKKISIFAELCEAVALAHRRGIMHRDLKPANVRITPEGHVRLMDWGIAKPFSEVNSGMEFGKTSEIQLAPANLTQEGSVAGTIGYLAPEVAKEMPLENPRSPDIFALGVILYEWITAFHPWAKYRSGDLSKGEAARVMMRHDLGYPLLEMPEFVQYVTGQSRAPAFSEVLKQNLPPYFSEIENIARKAMAVKPGDRYPTVEALREDLLMAYAHWADENIRKTEAQIPELESRMHQAWDAFEIGKTLPWGQWEAMHQPILTLRRLHAAAKQEALNLIRYLEITFRGDLPHSAKRMIASLAWKNLVREGDRILPEEKTYYEDLIRLYDSPDSGEFYAESLHGKIPLRFDIRNESGLQAFADLTKIRISEFQEGRDEEGNASLIYTAVKIFEGKLSELPAQFRIGSAYYLFEIAHQGYPVLRLPLSLEAEQIRQSLKKQSPFLVKATLIEASKIPRHMQVIQGGEAYLGIDYLQEANPTNLYSTPLRKVFFPTFALSRYPVTVKEYRIFVDKKLHELNEVIQKKNWKQACELAAKLRAYIPRGQVHLENLPLFLESPSPEILEKAFQGSKLHWKIELKEKRGIFYFVLQNPSSHKSATDEVILDEQPISSISLTAARAYLEWRSERDGVLYRLPERQELERVARNGFRWNYPWGYVFHPYFVSSRLIHPDVAYDSHPRAVGTHVAGPSLYRDVSAYGVHELVGNVRKFTNTRAEGRTIWLFGASTRTGFGPFFFPAAQTQGNPEFVAEYIGGIFLAMDIPSS